MINQPHETGGDTKQCSRCGQHKPLTEFSKKKSGKHGLSARCKSCCADSHKEWFSKNSEYYRARDYRNKYGITIEDFDRMYEGQGGCCATCATAIDKSAHVDHCHSTGKVRGLLCHFCNVMLGHARDNTETLRRAIAYLEG